MKSVIVGVTGGIAAYKACEIISNLVKLDYNVDVIMTENSNNFITPLTMQTLSKNLVHKDMFQEARTWEVEHIELAKKADLILVVPASANIIGKVANGIADDMLSTVIMASKAKTIFAPAMNTTMYENPIVQSNIKKLKSLGYLFVDPVEGLLACNDVGKGKLANPSDITEFVLNQLEGNNSLLGKNVLITAGPTREAIDPVRFITNKSTGIMGYLIAREAVKMGANVTLVSGKVDIKPPLGLGRFVPVISAEDMYNETMTRVEEMDIIIKTAAVADYTPSSYSDRKIKKTDEDLSIPLKRTFDIAYEIGKIKKNDQVFIGFAAETNDLLENAKKKIDKKKFDFIVANDIGKEGAGFGGETNIVTILYKNGNKEDFDLMKKSDVARLILNKILEI